MKALKSAKLLVFDSEDNVLVLTRSGTHPWSPHAPDLPGGIIDSNESFEVGVLRELQEETGLTLDMNDLEKLYEIKDIEYHDFVIHRVIFGVKLPNIQPAITLSWEHEKFEWKKLEDVEGIETENQKGINIIRASQQR